MILICTCMDEFMYVGMHVCIILYTETHLSHIYDTCRHVTATCVTGISCFVIGTRRCHRRGTPSCLQHIIRS